MLRPQRRRRASLAPALWANAGLLAVIALVLLSRGGARWPESIAYGQQAPMPIAGGAGFFLMPGQLGPNNWGCYVMDVDAQTLVVYRYDPGAGARGELRLAAARSFAFDRRLRNYNNADPKPDEVARLVALERDDALRPDNGATSRPSIPQ